MKTFYTFSIAILTLATLSQTSAQQPPGQRAERPLEQARRGTASAGQLDEKTSQHIIRVSQLIGMNIQNTQGESLGEIEDIVLDANSGKVRYAAVTYGGLLGLGDKLFAVPYDAFQVRREAGDDSGDADYVLVLNVSEQQLKGQQGFDEENWPDMADAKWSADLDKRFGVNRNEDAKDRLLRQNRQRNNQ